MQAAFLEVYLYTQGERRKQRCAEYKWNSDLLQILNQLLLITDARAEPAADPASGDAQPGFGLVLAALQGSETNPEHSGCDSSGHKPLCNGCRVWWRGASDATFRYFMRQHQMPSLLVLERSGESPVNIAEWFQGRKFLK